jgi:hypothetical protein
LSSLPRLGLPGIKERADSGAATSSLHAFKIDTLTNRDAMGDRMLLAHEAMVSR